MASVDLFSKANEAFVEEDYEGADRLYSEALSHEPDRDDIYAARAHARIKLEKYKDAQDDSAAAIKINPKNSKAHVRNGQALFHQEHYESALGAFHEGKIQQATDKNLEMWISKCQAEMDKLKMKSESSDGKPTDSTAAKSPVEEIPMPTGPKTRYDWYQTETHVIISVLIKNVKRDDLQSKIEDRNLDVVIKMPTGSEYSLCLDLLHPINPTQSLVKVLSSKVEIKLKKVEGIRWQKLEGEAGDPKVKEFKKEATGSASSEGEVAQNKYPSSSHHTRDWDKLVADISKEEKDEKPEGDAALNQLFQQIYGDGSEEVRKAMNKSFVESGGTVLSTNWDEIKQKKVDVKPPDGMEFKSYSS